MKKSILKRGLQKKGQSEVLTMTLLFEVLAGFLLAGLLIYATLSTGDVEGFSKRYLKADHDILLATINSLPGDIDIDYPTGGYKYENGEFRKGALNTNYVLNIKKVNDEITENVRRE